jgi:aerobic-type carbon monoxide dehydrogenase small subunit (CoxS/CutS family)
MNDSSQRGEPDLIVNGRQLRVAADPQTPLLFVLRDELGLASPRLGCGAEQCGSCTVLLDGAPAYSCTLTLAQASGHRVETVEGLAAEYGGERHPLQRAFLEFGAAQCGYCLSGILMSAKALLTANPAPTRAEIAAALDPHLCRCGAHPRMLRAVARAAELMAVEA